MQQSAATVEARPPSFIRTLVLAIVNFVIWWEINIRRGSYTALIASGWLIGSSDSVLWAIALAGSATQWYVTREWENSLSLLARSRLFRWGSAVILFIWDIAFPAWGLLVSAQKDNPWSWELYAIAVGFQLVGSWYCQQNWTDATGDLWQTLRGWRTHDDTALLSEGGQE